MSNRKMRHSFNFLETSTSNLNKSEADSFAYNCINELYTHLTFQHKNELVMIPVFDLFTTSL